MMHNSITTIITTTNIVGSIITNIASIMNIMNITNIMSIAVRSECITATEPAATEGRVRKSKER